MTGNRTLALSTLFTAAMVLVFADSTTSAYAHLRPDARATRIHVAPVPAQPYRRASPVRRYPVHEVGPWTQPRLAFDWVDVEGIRRLERMP